MKQNKDLTVMLTCFGNFEKDIKIDIKKLFETKPNMLDYLKNHISICHSILYDENKMPIGFASAGRKNQTGLYLSVNILIYIDEKFRNLGYGTKLLQEIIEHTQEFTPEPWILYLCKEKDQTDMNFARKNGFQITKFMSTPRRIDSSNDKFYIMHHPMKNGNELISTSQMKI